MQLPEAQVEVEITKDGRWAQEPWKKQLVVKVGDKVTLSVSIAMKQQAVGKCKIIKPKPAKQVKKKVDKNPAAEDKKAAEG